MKNDLIEPMDEPPIPEPSGGGVGDLSEAVDRAPTEPEVLKLVREKVNVRCVLTPRFVREIEVDRWRQMVSDNLVYSLTGWVSKLPNQGTLRLPKTWWDGFKIDHFPKWLRRRYPPEYTTYTAETFVKNVHLPPGVEPVATVFHLPPEEAP